MRKQAGLYVAVFGIFCLLLTGCLGAPRVETIVMDDTPQMGSNEGTSKFAVQTIYTVLDGVRESSIPVGWINDSSLLGISVDESEGYLARVNEPFAVQQKLTGLRPLKGEGMYNSVSLSPDGHYVSYVETNDNEWEMTLHSLVEGQDTKIAVSQSKDVSLTQMTWSANSRFFGYVDIDETQEPVLFVYDRVEKEKKRFMIPSLQADEMILFVSISDNGEEALIVKQGAKKQPVLEWGKLSGDSFVAHDQHTLSHELQVEWIHQDQIAFVGADGTLYAYDQRNQLRSELLHDVGRFRFSSDRKYIAYTQGDAVFAASLYGNTLLRQEQIYKGIDVYDMAWSPNNSKLLLNGIKMVSKPHSQTGKIISTPAEAWSSVIAFR
ncbi:hypothetical protein [Cohnella nanjingensis]|uniref:WD40 repeat domain-containing protein n=1 Tax=Cohnella nanjingensis TaxID=1387779 RepID=A0A7X0RM81_9BACL|nr:hypothetical protein [Cohnella nanjingensis]MBB6670083.1 hypothetical protein [Cohnella nanjingensis]